MSSSRPPDAFMRKPKANRKEKAQPSRQTARNKAANMSKKKELLKKSLETRKEFEKLTVEWQEKLYEPVTISMLQESAKFMQPMHYNEVIEERNANNLCGYPICPRSRQEIEGQYRISLRARTIYNVSELKCFCSDTCFKASKFFSAQLSDEAIYMRDFQDWKTIEVVPLDVDIGKIIKREKNALSNPPDDSGVPINLIKTLLENLPPAPPDLVIKENLIQDIEVPKPPTVNEYDSIEGFRIEFSKFGNGKDKPSTLVLSKEEVTAGADTTPKTDEEVYELAMLMANSMFRNGQFHYDESGDMKDTTSNTEPSVVTEESAKERNNTQVDGIKPDNSDKPEQSLFNPPEVPQIAGETVNGKPKKATSKRRQPKKIVPQMSLFGRIWTALDRMTTPQTRKYFQKVEPGFKGVLMTNSLSEATPPDNIISTRRNIFSEKIMECYKILRPVLAIEFGIEDELINLTRTFTFDTSSVLLNDRENSVLCLVFVYALSLDIPRLYRSMFSTKTGAYSDDNHQFGNLIGNMGLTMEEMDAFVRVIRVSST